MKVHNLVCVLALNFSGLLLSNCQPKRIVVTGVAKNDKNIATVISKTQQYFLNGIYQWDSNYLNKSVKVKGILLVSRYIMDTVNPINFSQRHNKDMYFILKAKWKQAK